LNRVLVQGYNCVCMRLLLTSIVAGLVLLGTLAGPDLALAHVRTAAAPADAATPAAAGVAVAIVAGSPVATPLWPVAACLALAALGLMVLAPRRTLYLALALVIAVFAVEAGVHSVHHLADRHAATHCVVSAASANVQGASVEASVVPWVPIPVGTITVAVAVRPGASPLRPDEGRAPPA